LRGRRLELRLEGRNLVQRDGERGLERGGFPADAVHHRVPQPFKIGPQRGTAAIFAGLLAGQQQPEQAVGIMGADMARLAVAPDLLLDAFDGALIGDQLQRQPVGAAREPPALGEAGIAAPVIIGGPVGDADQRAGVEH
jgi:hypothetical protein